MRVTYDPVADAAYIYFANHIPPGGVARTRRCTDYINLDFDHNDVLVGIEVLDARRHLALAAMAEALPVA